MSVSKLALVPLGKWRHLQSISSSLSTAEPATCLQTVPPEQRTVVGNRQQDVHPDRQLT